MFKSIIRITALVRMYRNKFRTRIRNAFLKAVGKDPAFNPNNLEWHLGPISATSDKMRQLCLKMMLGKTTYGDLHAPEMAPTESSMMFDKDSKEGTTITVDTDKGKSVAMKFRNGKWVFSNYAGNPECIISPNELPYVNYEPTRLHDAYVAAYETKTQPVLAMMRRFYEDNIYCFRNVKYRAAELQSVIVGLAMGRLPMGIFKYTEGEGYSSIVPETPADGATIVTMPNYETFATFKNGLWELNLDITMNEPCHIQVNSAMLPYIGGKRTVTCYYEAAYDDSELPAKAPAKLAVSFGVSYNHAQTYHNQSI